MKNNNKDRLITFLKTRKGKSSVVLLVLLIWYSFSLPSRLFLDPCSTVLEDAHGALLGARIASDGQWRFPDNTYVPDKFAKALVCYEDKHFYTHPGFNPVSLWRALVQDIRRRKIVSGGSTLSMQIIRMSRKGKSRNLYQKMVELILATRLELRYSKKEILALYASHAPFGSNVVGLDAASWRYFGRSPDKLSWAEAATLAILPNAPSLIYPGKHQEKLKKKRDQLLEQLCTRGEMDQQTCELAKQEPLPDKPHTLPDEAPHLLDRASAFKGQKGKRIISTLDAGLQERIKNIIEKHHKALLANEIHNAAVVVLEVETGKTIAYIGNTEQETGKDWGNDVDVVMANRSSGSILKPFLYAGMLTDGQILPSTLIPDIPMQFGNYAPQNYSETYDGAVPAKRALARSLNVPAVKLLQQYHIERFHELLKEVGLTTITRTADNYGLTLILGGAEVRLWDLAGAYASMARTLNQYNLHASYSRNDFHPAWFMQQDSSKYNGKREESGSSFFDAASTWITFEAMVEVNRPDEDAAWRDYLSSGKIAWKTGTSFGFRDGWAIGLNPGYVVAVWTGNSSGEGRPGLVGVQTAAPILFEVFGQLPAVPWFKKPEAEMVRIAICKESGCKAGDYCEKEMAWIQKSGMRSLPCPYHKLIHVDESGKFRVNSDCEELNHIRHIPWFILPPAMEVYFKRKHASYQTIPPLKAGCKGTSSLHSLELVYPKSGSKIYVPVELNGQLGRTVFEAAHRKAGSIIYWHLDDNYIGMTTSFHQMAFAPSEGRHTLTLVDENGETVSEEFEIIGKGKK
ncbi:MAG: penicillin-binding protein 1C [Bacteroidia bacterium]